VTTPRPVTLFGDGAVLAVADSVEDAHQLAAAINDARWVGVQDIVVGFEAVTVIVDPIAVDVAALAQDLAGLDVARSRPPRGRRIEIPVVFDGADLEDVAHIGAVTVGTVGELLASTELVVAFLGFAPGFAYLVGLPSALRDVPRRRTPRPSVPAGSVAIGGGFAGIYPQSSPGGWHLVGRSGAVLFDPETPPFSLLLPGDRVRLVPSEGAAQPGTHLPRPKLKAMSKRTVTVRRPGMLSLVEDLGRTGTAALGVPRSGGADPFSLRTANRLVGNSDDEGALEVTAAGPSVLFSAESHVVVVGDAETTIDGVGVPSGSVLPVTAGQVLSIGAVRHGLRAYLAVDGGFDVAPVLGSRSSDVLAQIGPGPLMAGDVLGLGSRRRPHGRLHDTGPGERGPAVLRVMAGPDSSIGGMVEQLCDTVWEVQADSDRVGVRLGAGRALPVGRATATSRGMVTGAIQVPPDGRPIVLLCDHATVGGYLVPATVVSADLGVLGQCRPGDLVRFDQVDHLEAVRARASRERVLNRSIVGWFPVRSD
jgi:KipI family sensor histidine kinase inhibitor